MILLFLLAVSGLSFLLKEAEGPFDLISRARNALFTSKQGPLFLKLFECPFCLGIHCSLLIAPFLIYHYGLSFLIPFVLAGAVFNLGFWKVFDYVSGD